MVSKDQAVSSIRSPKDAESWSARAVCRLGRPNIVKRVIARHSGRIVRVSAAAARGFATRITQRREEDRGLLILGLVVPVGAGHPQSTNQVTATCKDGSTFSATTRSGACRVTVACCRAGWRQQHRPHHPSLRRRRSRAPMQRPVRSGSTPQVRRPLPRHAVVRQGEARRLRARGASKGAGGQDRKGLRVVIRDGGAESSLAWAGPWRRWPAPSRT